MRSNPKTRPTDPLGVVPQRVSGKFAPGVSGNLQGRPRSETAALRQTLADGAADVVKAVFEAALSGDMQAAKLILDRLLPTLKATAQVVHLPLAPEASPTEIGRLALEAVADGRLAPDVAETLVRTAAQLAKIEEVEQLRARIEALEKSLTKAKNTPRK